MRRLGLAALVSLLVAPTAARAGNSDEVNAGFDASSEISLILLGKRGELYLHTWQIDVPL